MKEPPSGQVTTQSPKPKLPNCWPKICTFSQEKALFVHVQAHPVPRCLGHDAGPLAPQPGGQGWPHGKHVRLERALAVLKSTSKAQQPEASEHRS